MVMKGVRKGDVTITTVILIILGLVVLVMMIIGFTKGWDFFFGKFDELPSELQTIAKACVLYAQGGLGIDFCQYRLVGKELVNCRDTRIDAQLKAEDIDTTSASLKCGTDGKAVACRTLASGKPDTKIDGKPCASLFACFGTPLDCGSVSGRDPCQLKEGCTWDTTPTGGPSLGICVGVVDYCKTLDETSCKARSTNGCTWSV